MKKHTDFQDKKSFFAYLKKNKDEIILLKKSSRKFTDPFGTTILQQRAVKALNTNYQDDVMS